MTCIERAKREDNFRPDPKLPSNTDLQKYYFNAGYDRGHNYPAADGACDKRSMDESFFFSNMTPQTPQLNRGDWKLLEVWCRDLAVKEDSLKIWCGSVGSAKKLGSLHVPKLCWKVIYVKKKKQYFAYLFHNDNSKPDGIENNLVDLKTVEKLSNFKFK